jgi:hypothetical protein
VKVDWVESAGRLFDEMLVRDVTWNMMISGLWIRGFDKNNKKEY